MRAFVICKPFVGLLLISLCLDAILALKKEVDDDEILFDTVCRDENGDPLDWFIVYKFPQGKGSTLKGKKASDHFLNGLGYGFITSENLGQNRFEISEYSIDDENSMIVQTLKPIYEANDNPRKLHSTPLMYAMWNDQTPPGGPGGSGARAHSKGVLMVNKNSRRAALLSHSVPQFPKQRRAFNSFFPFSAQRYGQAFMCISFDADLHADAVAEHLDYIKPIIYDSFFSKSFTDDHPLYTKFKVQAAAKTISKLGGPKKSKQTITTLGGKEIDLIAKTRGYKTDIYSTLISDFYGPLYVQSWQNGHGGKLYPSDNVCNVDYMTLMDEEDNELASWTGSKDHAKWALTKEENDRRVVCIGDINRMESQFTRGGGMLCMEDDEAWQAMRSMISSCESSSPKKKFVSTWFDDDDKEEESDEESEDYASDSDGDGESEDEEKENKVDKKSNNKVKKANSDDEEAHSDDSKEDGRSRRARLRNERKNSFRK